MLALLCFRVATEFSVNKYLYFTPDGRTASQRLVSRGDHTTRSSRDRAAEQRVN